MIRAAEMQNLQVVIASILPEVDCESGMNVNVEPASLAVGLAVVRVLVRMLADFAEALPQKFLFAPGERRGEVEDFHRDQEAVFHSGAFGGKPSRCPNSSSVTQMPGVRSSILRARC